MWFLSKQAMQKIRTYLKESVIDYQDRLDNKNPKTKKNIVHSSTKPWSSFISGTLELCKCYLSIFAVPLKNIKKSFFDVFRGCDNEAFAYNWLMVN